MKKERIEKKSVETPLEKANRRALAATIRARLAAHNITTRMLAEETLMKARSIEDVISGWLKSRKAKQRITDVCGFALWPGIRPRDAAAPRVRLAEDDPIRSGIEIPLSENEDLFLSDPRELANFRRQFEVDHPGVSFEEIFQDGRCTAGVTLTATRDLVLCLCPSARNSPRRDR